MILQCRVCRREMTAAALEGVFVNPVILFSCMPLHMAIDVSKRHVPFGYCIWLLVAGPLLPFLIVGGIFLLCWWLLKGAVYLTSFMWQCPACGSRRWAWPRTGPLAFP
jgi:hypothetical protein